MSTVDDVLIERLFSPLAGRLHHALGIGQWRVAIECLNGSVALYVGAVAFETGAFAASVLGTRPPFAAPVAEP